MTSSWNRRWNAESHIPCQYRICRRTCDRHVWNNLKLNMNKECEREREREKMYFFFIYKCVCDLIGKINNNRNMYGAVGVPHRILLYKIEANGMKLATNGAEMSRRKAIFAFRKSRVIYFVISIPHCMCFMVIFISRVYVLRRFLLAFAESSGINRGLSPTAYGIYSYRNEEDTTNKHKIYSIKAKQRGMVFVRVRPPEHIVRISQANIPSAAFTQFHTAYTRTHVYDNINKTGLYLFGLSFRSHTTWQRVQ